MAIIYLKGILNGDQIEAEKSVNYNEVNQC